MCTLSRQCALLQFKVLMRLQLRGCFEATRQLQQENLLVLPIAVSSIRIAIAVAACAGTAAAGGAPAGTCM